MINDAKDKVLEWRARPAAAPAPRGVALVKKKMKRSNYTFYCDNPLNKCTVNRKHKDNRAGSGGGPVLRAKVFLFMGVLLGPK